MFELSPDWSLRTGTSHHLGIVMNSEPELGIHLKSQFTRLRQENQEFKAGLSYS